MPLYEYQCRKCGRVSEVIQKFSDPLLKKCSECGGRLERLFSPPAIQFKGTGWYITDYARKGSDGASRNGDTADSSSKSDSNSKESTATEKPKTSTAKD